MNVLSIAVPAWTCLTIPFLFHAGDQHTAATHLMGMWNLEPSILLGCAGLLLCYIWVQRFRLTAASLFFTAGVLVLLLALASPLHLLGEHYLFSAHMTQHLLLVLVVPPLLLLGTPAWLFRKLLRWAPARRAEAILGHPFVAWTLLTVAIFAWHVPALFNATLENEPLHIFEHLVFLVTGTIFWWPVMSPLKDRQRLGTGAAMFYLFAAGVSNCILGIILTFSSPGLYPAYVSPTDPYGILVHIRYDWGLSPTIDQQLGGMIMWVPGCLAYIGAILGVMARWYAAEPSRITNYELRITNMNKDNS
ncbi:MAG: cytochrome c oxidase assembly protein [Chloroflexia bacterium]